MKKPIFFLLAFLLVVTSFHTAMTVISHGGHQQTSHVAKYTVTNSNESAVYSWWTEDFSASTNYNVPIGSEIEVEIDDPTNLNTGINVTIGNLTALDETDLNAENNLGVGYWQIPKMLGFISTLEWSELQTNMSSLGFTTFDFDDEAGYTFGATTFDAVNITFADAFQSTSLSYNKDTGVLYYADIVIFNFVLEFEITGYIPYEKDAETSEEDVSLLFPIFALVAIFSVFNRRKI
ncbi:MAG: hypothetical protein ACXAE3_04525 [Candidatus Kariarchaeaceae archaeon]